MSTKRVRITEPDDAKKSKKIHSLDSDEEDEPEVESRLDDDDIEGQEDDPHMDFDGDIKITPFNLKEEMEEGHFDKDGSYVWNKDKEEVKDAWLDNIDWQKVKQVEPSSIKEESDGEDEHVDKNAIYVEMLELLKPGESVTKALRRLGGGKIQSASERWKKKKAGDVKDSGNKEEMLKLTELADTIVSSGDMDVYQETYESITFKLNKDKTKLPQGVTDDDALDIFADSIDSKQGHTEVKEGPPEKASTVALDDEIQWEYKWKAEDKEIHGPFSSEKMLDWCNSDYFKSGVLVRKCNRETEWYSSSRIDFELYT